MSDYPKDWEEVKINNVSPIRGGYAFKSEMYVKNGVPIVRISNILSNETIGGDFECYKSLTNDNDFKLFNGSVVIAMSGATTGKVALLRLKKEAYYYQNQRVGYFKESDDINNCFLFYVVRGTSFKKYLNSILSTGAQPNISPKQINKFSFKKPPLEEQKAIADTLMTFDKHIENLEKLIEKKKMIRDGAVEDLMTGKTRLDGFDGEWEEKKIGELCYIVTKQTGFDYTNYIKDSLKKSKSDHDISFIQNKDFSLRQINMDTDYYIPLDVAEQFPKILLEEKCLLISISGRVGNVGVYEKNKKAFLGGAICVLKFSNKKYIDWIMYYLSSKKGSEILIKNEKKAHIKT